MSLSMHLCYILYCYFHLQKEGKKLLLISSIKLNFVEGYGAPISRVPPTHTNGPFGKMPRIVCTDLVAGQSKHTSMGRKVLQDVLEYLCFKRYQRHGNFKSHRNELATL